MLLFTTVVYRMPIIKVFYDLFFDSWSDFFT